MTAEKSPFTIVLNHPAAEHYAQLIGKRFPQIRAIVASDRDRLERYISEADALLAFHFPVEVFDKAKRLRWFQCTGAGVDSMVPIRDKARFLTVTNARGIGGDLIADYVMAGVAMLQWDFRGFWREQQERQWRPRNVSSLADKVLGVIGLGSIGATIARRAKSAGMTVLGSKRDPTVLVEGVDRLFGVDIQEMLPLCDFVVLAVPATAETVRMIGAAEFATMRREAFLINIARGNVIDEAELIEALRSGTIAGAMLDVFEREPLPNDSPLWGMTNVIATPHVAGNATSYVERVFAILAENIERFLAGRPLKNVVDLGRGY